MTYVLGPSDPSGLRLLIPFVVMFVSRIWLLICSKATKIHITMLQTKLVLLVVC